MDTPLYSVDEVVRRCNVTPRTLHYYEEVGLIQPVERTPGGHRLYDEEVLQRLEHILRIKENLGYTLQNIRAILEAEEQLDLLRETYHALASDDEKSAIVEEYVSRLMDIVTQIEEKQAMLARMREGFEARLARAKALQK